jgi:hypothetical protein
MWDAPDQDGAAEPTRPRAWLLVSETLLVAVVSATLFRVAPRIPNGSAEAGFVFSVLLLLVSIATLRFLCHAADFALRE